MPPKIRQSLNDEQFAQFCEELRDLPGGSDATLPQIRELAEKYGISVSKPGAAAFKKGPFAKYIERIESGRNHTDALVAAARGGSSNLDALEEVAIMELQDHVTSGGTIDIKFLIGQLSKLRLNLSMREESRRKELDLERKLRETEKRIEISDKELQLRDAKLLQFEREKQEWEEQRAKIVAAANKLRTSKPDDPDALRAKVVDEIDRVLGITK